MRQEKQLYLDEIQEKIEGANTFLIARYEGLDAQKATELRKAIRETDGDFEVVRKRLLLKAGIEIDPSLLEGHIALVLAYGDPVETTKALFKMSNGALKVLVGRFDGIMYSGADVEKISKLPNFESMRAQMLGLFEAPMAQTLAVMDALLCVVPCLLENRANKGN